MFLSVTLRTNARCGGVGGRKGRQRSVQGVSPRGAAFGADLGISSNYSIENIEDGSEQGFLVKGIPSRISRS